MSESPVEEAREARSPPPKKCGVSGDSVTSSDTIPIPVYAKDSKARQLIKDALLNNTFLQNSLDGFQLRLIVDAMYDKTFEKNDFLCEQGAYGTHLFVTASGSFQVIANGRPVKTIGPGKVIGELAILYNCTRTASVQALTKSGVWVLDRKVFQAIMINTSHNKRERYRAFLKSVPLLQSLDEELIARIVDVIELFPEGNYICRQGYHGDSFYIVANGSVRVTQEIPIKDSKVKEEKILRTLKKGDYFGEQALLSGGNLRTANVISEECECLVLDSNSFYSLVGDLNELRDKRYNINEAVPSETPSSSTELSLTEPADHDFFNSLKLEDFQVIATLGVGGFGKVDLVYLSSDPEKVFALKSCAKVFINTTQQQEHLINEKVVQKIASQHQFVVKLYRTFKDQHCLYFLLEAALGGELWTLLKKRGRFDESEARFYLGCVIEAIEFLHSNKIIYRDLKPENCLLDATGYLKITDFGFSKIITPATKTWTFCGTPEYAAPEIILNRGHDKAVDFWALGILLYELLTGVPPFQSTDPLKTYNIVLRGFDDIVFDSKCFSINAIHLIRRLCRDNPCERLGVQKNGINDVKKHKWFHGFDWEGLVNRQLKPPIVPILSGPADTRYFDLNQADVSIRVKLEKEIQSLIDQEKIATVEGWEVDF
uniref:cGMP-dependent protein kinase n=1 Tax=Tetranychus urticae TaxID=32264 RepID=T1K6W5_TETUR